MSLSLAERTVSIVTKSRENRLKELKELLLDRKHPQHIVDCSFTKIFQPKFQIKKIMITLHLPEPAIPVIMLI